MAADFLFGNRGREYGCMQQCSFYYTLRILMINEFAAMNDVVNSPPVVYNKENVWCANREGRGISWHP